MRARLRVSMGAGLLTLGGVVDSGAGEEGDWSLGRGEEDMEGEETLGGVHTTGARG